MSHVGLSGREYAKHRLEMMTETTVENVTRESGFTPEIVDRAAQALKTWKRAAPMLDGYRICGVVREGGATSFPSKTFATSEEAQVALDRLNAEAALEAAGIADLTRALHKIAVLTNAGLIEGLTKDAVHALGVCEALAENGGEA